MSKTKGVPCTPIGRHPKTLFLLEWGQQSLSTWQEDYRMSPLLLFWDTKGCRMDTRCYTPVGLRDSGISLYLISSSIVLVIARFPRWPNLRIRYEDSNPTVDVKPQLSKVCWGSGSFSQLTCHPPLHYRLPNETPFCWWNEQKRHDPFSRGSCLS